MNQNERVFEKQDIFKKRENILPYEYPELLEYKKAIRHSYWLESEFNFTSDINDFKIKVNDSEREAIKRTMLAIAQIEVKVKTFWADMYKRMPKTEIGDVGMTFAESEVRHKDAYAELLNVLGLQKEFETLIEVPAIKNRINYLTKYLDGTSRNDNKMYTKSVILFENLVYSACKKAFIAECQVLDWIFEKGELDFLSKEVIQHFIMNRFNNSLIKIGMKPVFSPDITLLDKTMWFEVEITSTKEGDFFYKRSVDYSKKTKSITEDDLF